MSAATGPAGVGVDALELFVEVLSHAEAGASVEGFYDRLSEAVCRLAAMRRAVIFRYDSANRRVRAVGAHGMSIAPFADAYVTVDSAPIAARALRSDQVVEFDGELTGQAPLEFAAFLAEPARLVCAPMASGGRMIGVILADRPMSEPPLGPADTQLLWTLGKAAALATVARSAASQYERSRALEQRIDLAREIHDDVIQRLFGVSMALDGAGDLPADARARCAAETQSALGDLRSALQRPLARLPRATATTFAAEVARLAAVHRELGLELAPGAAAAVPEARQALAQSVLREAVRNAVKHAAPTRVSIDAGRGSGAFWMEVVNDGVPAGPARRVSQVGAGIGLRLVALEALGVGGMVEFGERAPGTWQVRLVADDGGEPGGGEPTASASSGVSSGELPVVARAARGDG